MNLGSSRASALGSIAYWNRQLGSRVEIRRSWSSDRALWRKTLRMASPIPMARRKYGGRAYSKSLSNRCLLESSNISEKVSHQNAY